MTQRAYSAPLSPRFFWGDKGKGEAQQQAKTEVT
jgi:hypothetical protein